MMADVISQQCWEQDGKCRTVLFTLLKISALALGGSWGKRVDMRFLRPPKWEPEK